MAVRTVDKPNWRNWRCCQNSRYLGQHNYVFYPVGKTNLRYLIIADIMYNILRKLHKHPKKTILLVTT